MGELIKAGGQNTWPCGLWIIEFRTAANTARLKSTVFLAQMSPVVFPSAGKSTTTYLSVCCVPGILYVVPHFIKDSYPLRCECCHFCFSDEESESQEVK